MSYNIATMIIGGSMNRADEKTIEHNKNIIKSWLLELKYSIAKEGREPGCEWAIHVVEHSGNFNFAVSQPAGHPEVVGIAVTFSFEIFQSDIDRLPANERDDLMLSLWFKFLNLDIEFQPIGVPLNSVKLACHVYTEELRRGVFWRNVHTLKRASLIAQWTLQQKFCFPIALPPVTTEAVN